MPCSKKKLTKPARAKIATYQKQKIVRNISENCLSKHSDEVTVNDRIQLSNINGLMNI